MLWAQQAPFPCCLPAQSFSRVFPPPPESAGGALEDRKKVPWSDKETIILLEIWGDTQVNRDFQGMRSP